MSASLPSDAPRAVEHGQRPVRIFAHLDPGLDERGERLQLSAGIGEGVVACHDALLLDAQDLGQQRRIGDNKGTLGDLRRPRKARIMRGKIHIANEPVSGFDIAFSGKREFLLQPILQRPEHPLRPTSRLRRIGRNMLDPEPMSARPAWVSRLLSTASPAFAVKK